jgi:hypothetical protein
MRYRFANDNDVSMIRIYISIYFRSRHQGNAAIETSLGRALIYTFGFVSILLFGGLLLGAGAVTVAIFDDALIRCKVRILTRPWIATIIWGLLYYTWMSVIANVRIVLNET